MKRQIKLLLAVVGVLIILVATVFTAFASSKPTLQWIEADNRLLAAADSSLLAGVGELSPPAQGCRAMEVSEPALWYATDEEANVYEDYVVDEYPSGTTTIASGFEYGCVPKDTTLTVVYYYGGYDTEPVFVDSSKESPDNQSGTYWWYIGTGDGSGLAEGDWQVEWYRNKELLTYGEITLGGGAYSDVDETDDIVESDQDAFDLNDIFDFSDDEETYTTDAVTVQGTVVDGKTSNPIQGAILFVLTPGVTFDEWAAADFPAEDVFSGGETDSKGRFVCDVLVERNVTYSVVVGAEGYQLVDVDDFLISDEEEDPVEVTIKLYP